MIVFEIAKNGKTVCRAGRKDLVVLTAAITYVERKRPAPGRRAGRRSRTGSDLDLHVSGMSELPRGGSDHPKWLSDALDIGDDITIKIRRAQAADRWLSHTRYTPSELRRQQRAYYEEMKRKFERRRRATS